MNTIFDNIIVKLPQLNYFQQLTAQEKIYYLFELFETSKYTDNFSNADLASGLETFFNQLDEEAEHYDENFPEFESYDIGDGTSSVRVDVLVDNENVVLESNSLKAVRNIKDKFLDCGYLLSRDAEIEKIFRPDKVTRYLRVYRIIGRTFHLCYN